LLIGPIKFNHDQPPLHNYTNMNFRTMPEASEATGFMPYNYFTEFEVMVWTG
jgi:hypothetical protein